MMNFVCRRNVVTRGVISGVHSEGDENCTIVGYCDAASVGNSLQSVTNYHHSLRNTTE